MPTIMKGNKELTSQAVISNVLLTEQKLEQNEIVRQNFFNAYKECNPYSPTVTYVPNNKVIYMGGTYQNILTCTNITPTYNLNNDNWICIASSGTGGDMYKTVYDTHNKQADIFDYVDNKANTKLDIGNDYRPNLLANGDFKLWSLGTSFTGAGDYTETNTADKWFTIERGLQVSKTNDGAKLTTSTVAWNGIYQKIKDGYKLSGQTVTLSVDVDNPDNVPVLIQILKYDTSQIAMTSSTLLTDKISTLSRITLTATLPPLTELEGLAISVRFSNTSGTFTVKNVKLEVNDHATPFVSKTYKEELLNCSDNVGYAPNLLINGDFQVWQRGENFDRTSITGRFYGPDRWCCFRGNWVAGTIVTKEGDFFKATNPNATNPMIIVQSIESSTVRKLRGKAITFSLKLKGTTAFNVNLNVWYNNSGELVPGSGATASVIQKTFSIGTDFTIIEGTGSVPLDAQGLLVEVTFIAGNSSLTLEYAKLELNDHATPFIPLSYGEELELCKRYYRLEEETIIHPPTARMDNGRPPFYLPGCMFDVQMRVTPMVKIYSTVNKTPGKISEATGGGDTGANVLAHYSNPYGFPLIQSDTAFVDSYAGYNFRYEADAEI